MPDITMCLGYREDTMEECPLKHFCHRYTAEVNKERQAFFLGMPFLNGECNFFWDNAPNREEE